MLTTILSGHSSSSLEKKYRSTAVTSFLKRLSKHPTLSGQEATLLAALYFQERLLIEPASLRVSWTQVVGERLRRWLSPTSLEGDYLMSTKEKLAPTDIHKEKRQLLVALADAVCWKCACNHILYYPRYKTLEGRPSHEYAQFHHNVSQCQAHALWEAGYALGIEVQGAPPIMVFPAKK